jgi:quaternary ammonium compound-resistance protein SugE
MNEDVKRHRALYVVMLGVGLLVSGQRASAQLAPGSLDVKWSEGAEHCEAGPPQAPIQVHQYMKASHGFTKHQFTAITLVAAWVSFLLLGLAMRQLPVGTAYAVWTGIGAVGAAVLGILIFGESVTVARIGCIALIVCGILGLTLLGGQDAA